MAKNLELPKPPKRDLDKISSPEFRGLSTDYPSFELLWFDIETKTRNLIDVVITPIIEKLLEQRE